jgi:outer membrane protein OmpA-like peptidoglycan-associated protein
MLRMVAICSTAAAVMAFAVGSFNPTFAQDEVTFGSGPDRGCNPVVDSRRDPVTSPSDRQNIVRQLRTHGCPEPVAVVAAPVVAPAAPPLPASGLVLFDFDRSDLNPEAQGVMNDIIADIKDRELSGIIIGGHTDTAGPADYNMELSQRRAQTVAEELIKAGIPARIVTTEAFGQTDLAVETPDGVPLAANRRAVIDFQR